MMGYSPYSISFITLPFDIGYLCMHILACMYYNTSKLCEHKEVKSCFFFSKKKSHCENISLGDNTVLLPHGPQSRIKQILSRLYFPHPQIPNLVSNVRGG
jgi:hypothetical protein